MYISKIQIQLPFANLVGSRQKKKAESGFSSGSQIVLIHLETHFSVYKQTIDQSYQTTWPFNTWFLYTTYNWIGNWHPGHSSCQNIYYHVTMRLNYSDTLNPSNSIIYWTSSADQMVNKWWYMLTILLITYTCSPYI